MSDPLVLLSTSRATDAGYLAMADLAAIAASLGAPYRIVGGHMVSLVVYASGAPGIATRETADTDFGVPATVARDPALLAALADLGYVPTGASNRFARDHDALQLVVDVLAPSTTGQMQPNQTHGELVVDEIPGLSLALARAGDALELEVRLHTGESLHFAVLVPDVVAALCLKALAFAGRGEAKDAVDVARLLAAAHHLQVQPTDFSDKGTKGDARAVLRVAFGTPNGAGIRKLGITAAGQARVRALVLTVCGSA